MTAVATQRVRLDQALVGRGLVESRQKAQALIGAGLVRVDSRPADHADQRVATDAVIELVGRPAYVSRGGEKLAGALDEFGVDPAGRVGLDAGASTGGFTDVLLQRGAARVYAVDVGYGQLAWRLRQDERVVVMERTDIRKLESLAAPAPDLAVADMSFISLRSVLPAIAALLAPPAEMVVLFKPQFEVGRGRVGKGGIVRDEATRRDALDEFVAWAAESGLTVLATTESAIKGAKGNQESFVHMRAHG